MRSHCRFRDSVRDLRAVAVLDPVVQEIRSLVVTEMFVPESTPRKILLPPVRVQLGLFPIWTACVIVTFRARVTVPLRRPDCAQDVVVPPEMDHLPENDPWV